MPIAVACTCGARLQAPDAAAGKRVKCPKCQTPLVVPAPAMDYEVVEDEPAPAPAPVVAKARPKPQLVEDEDEAPRPAKKKPRVVDDEDEKPRKKSKPVEVDEAVEDDGDEKPMKSRRTRDDDEDEDEKPAKKSRKRRDDEEDEDDAPKKKAKSNLPLLLGVGGGMLVLAVVGIVVGVLMMNGNSDQTKGTNTTPGGGGTPPTQPQLPAGWSTFKGDGFSVAVPDAAQFKSQDPPNVGGAAPPPGGETRRMYTNDGVPPHLVPGNPPAYWYKVEFSTVREEELTQFNQAPEKMWDRVREASEAGKMDKFSVDGVEGREFTIPSDNRVKFNTLVRMAVKGNRVYVWSVVTTNPPRADDPNVRPFFDSFKFK